MSAEKLKTADWSAVANIDIHTQIGELLAEYIGVLRTMVESQMPGFDFELALPMTARRPMNPHRPMLPHRPMTPHRPAPMLMKMMKRRPLNMLASRSAGASTNMDGNDRNNDNDHDNLQ